MPLNIEFSPMLEKYKNEVQSTPSASAAQKIKVADKEEKDTFEPSYGEKKENIKKLEEKRETIRGKHGLLKLREDNPIKINNKILKRIAGAMNPAVYLDNDIIESYKNGKISYQEADRFLSVQSKTNDMVVNVLSGVAASFLATSAGVLMHCNKQAKQGTIIALAGLIGAAVNTGIKFIDRAFNKKKNDEYNPKTLAIDFGAGAINGVLSGWNATRGGKFTSANVTKKIGFEVLKQGAIVLSAKLLSDKANKDET